ncbi:tripartite motif-containing protein 54-like isoform X1 [Macrotis lagotis]|uniref:tripartite motif-containing protein 54-like isoform X1 n=1 Tax=Macrotis lagotis TaxID=92651 RepID=UPI003D692C2C
MEALGKVLSCPVCLDLFTPPVLVLSCSHNFCKQCLEQILLCQNCTHVNGQFCCPVCRKIIYLRGRGTNGLQRNILAENILEKFKDELETIHAKEQNQLAQMCEKHGEIMNLMCLNDDEPICGICKLFGDHKPHRIAKISEAYSARKITFVEDIQLVLQKSESTTQATEETEKLISELITSTADTRAMIDTIGSSLLNGIKFRIATLKKKLDNEHSTKLEKLQLVATELQAPRQLYQQMKTLLEQHLNAVQFLQEDKKLRTEMERLMEGNSLPKVPVKDNISIRYYFQELIKGMNITDFVLSKTDQVLGNAAELCEAWRSGCPTQSTLSGDIPDEIFCKTVLGLFRKPNEKEPNLPRNPSCSACTPTTTINPTQESDVGSKESTV